MKRLYERCLRSISVFSPPVSTKKLQRRIEKVLNEIEEARKKAEERMGFEIPSVTADYILGYTIRKFLFIILTFPEEINSDAF